MNINHKSNNMLIKIIITLLAVLITLYGVYKKDRVFFNTGYFITGIMITFDQLVIFSETSDISNLALAALWMIQASLALPNKLAYDGSNMAKSAAIKIYSTLSIINLIGVYYVVTDSYVPNEVMYVHILLAVLPLVSIYLVLSNKIAITK